MRTLLAFVAVVLALSGSVFASAPDPIEGRWAGTVGFPTDRVAIAFEFRRNAKGELKAYLYQSVMNFYGLELPGEVAVHGDAYELKDMGLSLAFKGDHLEGTYFSLKAPISLSRTERLPAEIPVPTGPKGPDPSWAVNLGSAIYAPAAVHDGVAYVGTSGGLFSAISLKDGTFVWTFVAGRPIFGGALVAADAIYVVCDNGFLFKLDRKTGKETWRYDLGDARAARVLPHQVVANSGDSDFDVTASKPLLVDGVLYVGSGDGSLHAVGAADGKQIWRFEAGDRIRTDPVVDGARVVCGSLDGNVYAVDRQTGKELWKKATYGPVTSSPAIVGGKVIVGNRNGLLAALDPATGEVVWKMTLWGSAVESSAAEGDAGQFYIGSSDLRRVSLMDSKDGRVVWRTDVFGWAWARPCVTEKVVYVSAIGVDPYEIRHVGSLTALDRASGKMVWRWAAPEMSGAYTSGFAAPPVVASNLLVVGGLDGRLYAFPVQ